MSSYIVKQGQNIYDCMLCISGDIQEIDTILELNGILTYTPDLEVGQVLDTTDIKKSNNEALLRADKYPFANEMLNKEELSGMISDIWSILYVINHSEPGYLLSNERIPLLDNNNELLYPNNG